MHFPLPITSSKLILLEVIKPYTESRFLPLALRLLITSLPAFVDMRDLKPCVRFLFKLLGWYVLFIGYKNFI